MINFLSILLSLLNSKNQSNDGSSSCTSKYQLTKDVIPKHYLIKIKPDLERFTFQGSEVIELNVLKITNTIILHAKNIVILNANYQDSKTKGEFQSNLKLTFKFN